MLNTVENTPLNDVDFIIRIHMYSVYAYRGDGVADTLSTVKASENFQSVYFPIFRRIYLRCTVVITLKSIIAVFVGPRRETISVRRHSSAPSVWKYEVCCYYSVPRNNVRTKRNGSRANDCKRTVSGEQRPAARARAGDSAKTRSPRPAHDRRVRVPMAASQSSAWLEDRTGMTAWPRTAHLVLVRLGMCSGTRRV